MQWKGKHKAGLREGYCSELLEGALVSRHRRRRRRSRSQYSSRRMYCRRGFRYCSKKYSGKYDRAQNHQRQWRGESFSHRALVCGPIKLFATYDVIRGGH